MAERLRERLARAIRGTLGGLQGIIFEYCANQIYIKAPEVENCKEELEEMKEKVKELGSEQ